MLTAYGASAGRGGHCVGSTADSPRPFVKCPPPGSSTLEFRWGSRVVVFEAPESRQCVEGVGATESAYSGRPRMTAEMGPAAASRGQVHRPKHSALRTTLDRVPSVCAVVVAKCSILTSVSLCPALAQASALPAKFG